MAQKHKTIYVGSSLTVSRLMESSLSPPDSKKDRGVLLATEFSSSDHPIDPEDTMIMKELDIGEEDISELTIDDVRIMARRGMTGKDVIR